MTARVLVPAHASAWFHKDSLVLFGVAWLLRLLVVVAIGDEVPPAADGAFYHVVAERIAQGQGYTWAWPDGAVTFAAHYPVGYAALLGAVYALGFSTPVAAMGLNATLGALAALVTYRLAADSAGRSGALLAGGLVALSPTLVGYTLALMTEGAVATGWIVALWLSVSAQKAKGDRRRQRGVVAAALVLGVTCLFRPQSLLLAPVLGLLAVGRASSWRSAGLWVLLPCAIALCVCLPWTLRNCHRMDRCVLVSANGGWNLLIGTFPEGAGAWVPIEGERVPESCREVFEEAAKDACFGAAGRKRILESPLEWIRLVPSKLESTFDFTASASAYLKEAGAPLSDPAREVLTGLEIGVRRLLVALALLGAWQLGRSEGGSGEEMKDGVGAGAVVGAAATARSPRRGGPSRRSGGDEMGSSLRAFVTGIGLLGVFGMAWVSHLAFVVLAFTARGLGRRPLLLAAGSAVAATLIVHSVFFGAGRYSMVLEPILAAVAASALSVVGSAFDRMRAAGRYLGKELSPWP